MEEYNSLLCELTIPDVASSSASMHGALKFHWIACGTV